jgi:hypothetical protein
MPQISTREFERLPLRVHDFLGGVPLHDVWAVDLPRALRHHLDEFLRTVGARLLTCSPPSPAGRSPRVPFGHSRFRVGVEVATNGSLHWRRS